MSERSCFLKAAEKMVSRGQREMAVLMVESSYAPGQGFRNARLRKQTGQTEAPRQKEAKAASSLILPLFWNIFYNYDKGRYEPR
jgi:hypothetical protein